MHPGGEGGKIGIVGADDDSGMLGVLAVEADEVLTIVREDRTAIFGRLTQNLLMGNTRVGFAGVVRGQHIMPEPTKCLDDGQREVFVRVETGGHDSSPFAAISRSISSRCERA